MTSIPCRSMHLVAGAHVLLLMCVHYFLHPLMYHNKVTIDWQLQACFPSEQKRISALLYCCTEAVTHLTSNILATPDQLSDVRCVWVLEWVGLQVCPCMSVLHQPPRSCQECLLRLSLPQWSGFALPSHQWSGVVLPPHQLQASAR